MFQKSGVQCFMIALLFLLSQLTVHAQTPAAPALFKLESGKTVMYFFGSIHVGTADMYPLNEKVVEAFKRSDALVIELNQLEINSGELMKVIQEKLMYPTGDSLDKHLQPEYLEKLKKILPGYGLQFEAIQLFKPATVDLIVSQVSAQALGYKEEYGIDMHFLTLANRMEKTILQLENVNEQMEAFFRIPMEVQVLMLTTTIDQQDTIKSDLISLVSSWKKGDLDQMYSIIEEQYIKIPEMMPAFVSLVSERNLKMKDRLVEMIKKGGKYFVVIGAGHFAGPDNIIEMLKKEGYTVTRQ